jgi:hypothetical protein
MTIKICDTHVSPYTGVQVTLVDRPIPGAAQTVVLDLAEQRALLEGLARIQGFTLVDHTERESLLALAVEADEDDNEYSSPTAAWTAWQDRCEALASAVASALGD